MKLKVIELFAGIGAPRKALENLRIEHENIGFSEIDKYAEVSYRAIFNDYTTPNFGDITQIKELPESDLITYGFPCQDISVAGYGKGIKEGTGSGLLLEVERLLNIAADKNKLPEYLLMENVDALLSKKHIKDFENWLVKLEKLGYKNFYKTLNAKDYGIPQNRDRIFCISVRDRSYKYIFPEKKQLQIKLNDMLEDTVEEKYYLKDNQVKAFVEKYKDEIDKLTLGIYPCLTPEKLNKRQNGRRFKVNNEEMFTLTAQDRHGIIKIGSLTDRNSQGERVYTTDLAVTLNANGGGLGAKTGLYLINGDISYCITANESKGTTLEDFLKKKRRQLVTDKTFRIRRPTPLECYRLMGFKDEDFRRIKIAGISDTQAYRQAGNSIVVDVLEAVFEKLFLNNTEEHDYKLF